MEPFSNKYTALCSLMVIVFSYLTAYGAISLKFGFALLFMSVVMLLASLVSALPQEHEFDVHKEIMDSDVIDDDTKADL